MYNFTIVVPCFNEENNVEKFVKITKLLLQDKYNYKILFIDDGSKDKTWANIENLKKNFSFINAIKLSKNFGKENALSCGLENIKDEDFLISIDADLQHPIEKIEEMIELWKKGNKVVATYKVNNTEKYYREIGSKLFYYIIKRHTDLSILAKTTDFILIDKEVVKKFNSITEVNKQFRTLVSWLGYKQINIPIQINERTSDKSKYNFISLFQLAVNNFTSFSLFPIKLIGWIGLFMTFFTIILLLIMLLDNIFLSNQLKINIQSIFLIIQILLTGVLLSSIAFLGLYISKILNNTNNRPSYIIEKKI